MLMLSAFIFALVFQGDSSTSGTVPAVAGVVPIIEGVGAATLCGYLVGFFKKAKPTAGSGSIVAVAIAAGLFGAVIISMVNGGIQMTQLGIGTIILQGIGAAALAAGVQVSNKPSVDSPITE